MSALIAANGQSQATGATTPADPTSPLDRAALRKLVPFGGSVRLFGAVWPFDADMELCDGDDLLGQANPPRFGVAVDHLLRGRWLASYGSPGDARDEFARAAAEYRRLAEARTPGQPLPLQYAEALYRSGELAEAEGLLRFMRDESNDWRVCLLYARLLLTRASALIAPGETEDALLVPGSRDDFLRSHRRSPDSVAAVLPLLDRARELLVEAEKLAPTSNPCRIRCLVELSRILVLDLLTQDAPRSTAEIRDAQLPPALVDELRNLAAVPSVRLARQVREARQRQSSRQRFCNDLDRVFDLRAGLALVRLPSDVPRVDVTRLPDPLRGAIARACEELQARFSESPARLVEGACAAIAALVPADYEHATLRDPELLEQRLADRALAVASVLLVLAARDEDLAARFQEEGRRAESRARLLLSHAHFRAGDAWRAESLARAALQQDPDDDLARFALASLLLRRSEDPGLLSVALRLAGQKGSTADGQPVELGHLPSALNALAMPALAAFHAELERNGRDDSGLLVEGIHLALCGDVARARSYLAILVLPPSLRSLVPPWSSFEQAREALALLERSP